MKKNLGLKSFIRSSVQKLTKIFSKWWGRFWASPPVGRRLIVVSGDSLPKELPESDLVLARDEGEDWCVGMKCPCGCGRSLELLLIPEARPRWKLTVDAQGRPSLYPSVWLKDGCKSHFWIKDGVVEWCESSSSVSSLN